MNAFPPSLPPVAEPFRVRSTFTAVSSVAARDEGGAAVTARGYNLSAFLSAFFPPFRGQAKLTDRTATERRGYNSAQFRRFSFSAFQRFSLCLLAACLLPLTASRAPAQTAPQDNWWWERTFPLGYTLVNAATAVYGIAVDASNRCYVANGSAIHVYDEIGALITNWPVGNVRGLAYDRVSNLVLACSISSSGQIQVYDTAFQQLAVWGTNSLSSPYGIAVGPDGLVYVADTGNNRIQVFSRSGAWQRQWGQTGTAGGEFSVPLGVGVGPDGAVYCTDYNNTRVQKFNASGAYLGQYGPIVNWTAKSLSASPDSLVAVFELSDLFVRMLDSDLKFLFTMQGGGSFLQGVSFSPDGQRLYCLSQTEVRVFRRGYRTLGTKLINAVPLPTVVNVAQRPGTSWIDIDFSVLDPDNTNVTAAAIAFREGRTDLGGAIRMTAFTNDTTVTLPGAVPTGVQHHLTWDANVDFSTNFFNARVHILAKDDRGLMDLHFLTLSNNIPNSSYPDPLTINRSPITPVDLANVWTWLVATGDPNITFQNGGTVTGVGTNDGVVYAATQISGTSTTTVTTASGREFLFGLLNVREATSNEIYRAKIGTTDRVTQWTPRVQIGGRPARVNEYGFDTGLFSTNNLAANPTNVWWVVPVQ